MKQSERKIRLRNNTFPKICIALTTIFGITACIGTILAFIATYKSDLIVPTSTIKTTTSSKIQYSIGQKCQYNYQCPEKAYCESTCQCPQHYYFDLPSGNCTQRKTYNITCTDDYECNTVIGLKCSTTCQCDTSQFWNSTYVMGTGVPLGRCQNKKVHGMACTGSDGANGIAYTSTWFGTQTNR
jgi:hypothetical protein